MSFQYIFDPITLKKININSIQGIELLKKYLQIFKPQNNIYSITKNIGISKFNFNNESKWKSDFSFIQLADPQFGKLNENTSWFAEKKNLDKAIFHINRLNPKFIVVCGDFVNAMPDNTSVYDEQLKDFKTTMKLLNPNIPLVCVCGNHDVGNRPTKKNIQKYNSNIGKDYFSFWVSGVRFLCINSQLYYNYGKRFKKGSIFSYKDHVDNEDNKPVDWKLVKKHEDWLNLELRKPVRTIVFSHIPPFFYNLYEKDSYSNIPRSIRFSLLNRLIDGGCCSLFCGHLHRNGGGFFKKGNKVMEIITSGAVGCYRLPDENDFNKTIDVSSEDICGLRIVNVTKSRVIHNWYPLSYIPDSL